MTSNEQLKQLLKEHVKQQKTTTGVSNLLQEVFKEAIQEMLQAEMDNHLGYEKHSAESAEFPNSRNGKTTKKVRTKLGQVNIEVPRDRNSSFEPQIIPKRKRIMEEIEDHVLTSTKHPYIYFPDSIAAANWYQQQAFQNTYLLIKGSRSMQMEKILQ